MADSQVVKIILDVVDKVSKPLKDIEDKLDDIGNTGRRAMENTDVATAKYQQNLEKTRNTLKETIKNVDNVGKNGASSFSKLTKSQQKAVVEFMRLDKSSQDLLRKLNSVGVTGMNAFLQLTNSQQKALTAMDSLSQSGNRLTNAWENAKVKLQILGQSTDGLTGNIRTLGTVIKDNLGIAWENASTGIGKFKNLATSALSTVRGKLDSLGQAFSGLGGIISGAVGAIGMNSIKDLTIGLAMTREQVTSLTQATMGSRTEAEKFMNTLDNMTNDSLVSLNDLAQAMNTIKMSTGMTNEQLESFSTVVNDIGQRAILMGKDSSEAMSLMQAAGRGLNGEFEILKSNFGITKQQLIDLGWSGAASDVDGYRKALEAALEAGGSMDDMMNTTTGLMKQVEKGFTSAGRQIGEMFMPAIKGALKFMVDLKGSCPGVYKGLILVAGGISGFATLAPTISPVLTAFDYLVKYTKSALMFLGLLTPVEGALTLQQSLLTAAQLLGADAAIVEAAATGGLSAAFGVLAGAIWAALAPLLPFIAAAAAIAIAVFEIGKAFGWWTDIGSMIDAVWAGIQRLWQAFINNPNVQAFLQALRDAWDGLCQALQPVIEWAKQVWVALFPDSATGDLDIVRMIIDAFGLLGDIIAFQIQIIMQLWETVQPFVEWLGEVLSPLFELIGGILGTIGETILQLIEVYRQFADGQITLQQLLTQVWTIIGQMFSSILSQIINAVIQWALNLWNQAVQAGMNFLNGVGQFISQLPGKVWNWIITTAQRIVSGVINWVTNGRKGASDTVTAVMDWIKQLPQKVYDEFINIGKRILDAIGGAVDAAKQFGSQVYNSVMNVLHIHSPGIIQTKIAKEFMDISGRITDAIDPAVKAGEEFAGAVVDSVGDPSLDLGMPSMSEYNPLVGEDVDNQQNMTSEMVVPVTPDTSQLQSGLADIGAVTQENNQMIAGSFDLMTQSMNTSLNQMVSDNQLAYSTMQSNDAMTMLNIRSNMSNSLTLMRNNQNSQLTTMLNNTKNTNSRVTSSWSQMGSSVIRTSEQIKTKSTGYFNQLSNTIGGFYRKLQNPSSWGAGGNYGGGSGRPTRNRKVGHTNTMTGKIRSIFQSRNIDNDTITLRQARVNPFIDTTSLSYISPSSNPNASVSLSTLARYGAIKLPKGSFGGWDATNVNYKHIHDTANKWKMKTPNIGPYATNGKFIVEQFETGVPQIDYNTFRSLAEDVYSQTDYDFYSDSDKYGNWVTAFLSGAFNCSDGADSLVAMAHAFGLSAHKVHGHWNNLGHFWAEVEGHKMDTTGWQQHRTWTPSQSHAGPAPRGVVTNPLEELKNIFTDSQNNTTTTENSSNDPLNVNINLNENHTVNLENVPDNINQNELETIITDMFNERTNDDTWIEKLVNNPVFQELDIRVKEWRNRANNRNNGVIH